MKYLYMDLLERFNIVPNFFCSSEYFQKAGWTEYREPEGLVVRDEDGIQVLPTIDYNTGKIKGKYWAGFPTLLPARSSDEKFLDYQFVYNPIKYTDWAEIITLPKWNLTRKNMRKLNQRMPIGMIEIVDPEQRGFTNDDIEPLLLNWAEQKGSAIHDPEVMTDFFFQGQHRRVLIDMTGRPVGLWVWDENYRYINFRLCVVKDIPGLSEYARLLFRAFDPGNGKPINDGGSLGSEGLYFFKKRLQPYNIFNVRSTV